MQVSRPAYGKLARLYRQHWIARVSSTGNAGSTAAAVGVPACTVGLPLTEAAAYLATLRDSCPAATPAAGEGSPAKRRKTSTAEATGSHDGSADHDSESDSDSSDSPDGDREQQHCVDAGVHHAAAAGAIGNEGGLRGKQQLDAEASIAEIEQQQQQKGQEAAGAGSRGARADFHARLFALLLRYKSIQGHGFQVSAT